MLLQTVFAVYKPVGTSPLDAITLLRNKHPQLQNEPITYAGRLDPMAEGVLILLTSQSLNKKDEFQLLDKVYQASFVLGFKTDTYDILGIVDQGTGNKDQEKIGIGDQGSEMERIENELRNYVGNITLPFPPYSSYKIKGKPLFQWARENKLADIEIPNQTTKVYSIDVKKISYVSGRKLNTYIKKQIVLVKGDFRQTDIIKAWDVELKNKEEINFEEVQINIHCSSGTYVRSIVNDFGKKLGQGAVLTKLVRSSVGKYSIKDCLLLE